MTDALAQRPLSGGPVAGLLLLYALVAAPHLAHLSPVLMAIFYAALLWRAVALRRPGLLPGRGLRILLTLGGIAAVVASVAGQLDGRALGVGLLTVMAGLKLLEFASRRDLYVMVLLGCFLLATQFLFDRGLWLTLYLAPVLLGLLSLLARINRVDDPGWRQAVRDTGRLLLAGLPMAIMLFVLFPRLAGPLWGLSAPAAGVSGLTDRIEPGSLSRLGQSQALAFRVSFDGEPPPSRQLYWRGPVFWDTDGRNWSAARPAAPAAVLPPSGARWTQHVTLEPSNQYWLFALERAVTVPGGAGLSRDGQLLSSQPVRQRRDYRVQSVAGGGEAELTAEERARALALPAGLVTERMAALLAGWRAADDRPAAVVAAALRYFREQPFAYTLQPPALQGNAADAFLFDSRRGFCEHYATSFVVLMRAAGIPARVVGGYQGGEWNPRGEHLVVRQSDAHAWAEVWLAGHGWQRVDPTAAVAPERIERVINAAASAEAGAVVFQADGGGWLATLWREGGWLLDSMELGWQRWVVGYSDLAQAGLLSWLGLGFLSGYRLALAAVVAAALGGLPLWWWLRRQPGGADPARQAYRRLQDKLRKGGMVCPESLAPGHLARRAGERFPAQRREIEQLVGLYLWARYGPEPGAAASRQLAIRVRRLRLG